jgi:Rrf2 family protein
MFRVSRRLDYGLQLMIALAQEEKNLPKATALLSEKLHIPLPFLHQIGRSLIQGGLLKATPGPRGGLRLSQSSSEISLLQIIETLEGPVRITPEPNGNGNGFASRAVWEAMQEQLIMHLDGITLNALANGENLDQAFSMNVTSTVVGNN